MGDIPAGDDVFRQFQHEHRAQYALRFEAWRSRALAEFSRPTGHGGRSVGEILRNEQPTAAGDETAVRGQLNAICELAELCRDFVIGELGAVACLEQRQLVAIDEILRRAAARAPDYQAEAFEGPWNVELRAIDGGRRSEYARAWHARVGHSLGDARVGYSLEDASWVRSAWSVVVEEPIAEYLEQYLKPALERHDGFATLEHAVRANTEWSQRIGVTPEVFVELVRKRLAAGDERGTFRHTRHGFEVTFQGQSRQGLPNRVGLRLIQQLLRNPHQRMHVSTLVGLQVEGHGTPLSDGDFALDGTAIKALQERLKELSRQREQAQKDGDLSRRNRVTNEYEQIDAHLRANTGLHGKARRLGSDVEDVERVRKRAWAQYTSGVELLGDLPRLVQHLEESVETGHQLIYQPKLAIEWNTTDTD